MINMLQSITSTYEVVYDDTLSDDERIDVFPGEVNDEVRKPERVKMISSIFGSETLLYKGCIFQRNDILQKYESLRDLLKYVKIFADAVIKEVETGYYERATNFGKQNNANLLKG